MFYRNNLSVNRKFLKSVTRDTGLNLGLFKDPVIIHELDWLR